MDGDGGVSVGTGPGVSVTVSGSGVSTTVSTEVGSGVCVTGSGCVGVSGSVAGTVPRSTYRYVPSFRCSRTPCFQAPGPALPPSGRKVCSFPLCATVTGTPHNAAASAG